MKKTRFILQYLINIVIIAGLSAILALLLTRNNHNINIMPQEIQDRTTHNKNQENTLISAQIVFRHGNRTPEPGKLYKLDPYNNYSFYPENYGEVTTKGRKSAYNLGKRLRQTYSELLDVDYYPGLVKSYVSGYDRTQMSLQCVHAGLFPNTNSLLGTTSSKILWRPITYEIFDVIDDNVIAILVYCKTLNIPSDKPSDSKTIKLFEFLSEKSGEDIKTYYDAIAVSNAFHVESGYGLELPDWGKSLYPDPLLTIDQIAWGYFAKVNIRLGAGGLLKMITHHAFDAIKSVNFNADPKIVLYSGHDYNLLFLRHSLHIEDIDSSDFSAYLSFELHKIDGVFGFKIVYNNYKEGHPVLLSVPFCKNDGDDGTFCKLDIFVDNTEWYYNPSPFCS